MKMFGNTNYRNSTHSIPIQKRFQGPCILQHLGNYYLLLPIEERVLYIFRLANFKALVSTNSLPIFSNVVHMCR